MSRLWAPLRTRCSVSLVGIVLIFVPIGMIVDYDREYQTHLGETVNVLREQANALRLARGEIADSRRFAEYVSRFCQELNESFAPGHHILVLDGQGQVLTTTRHHSGPEVERAILEADPAEEVVSVGSHKLAQGRAVDGDGTMIIVAQYLDHMEGILRGQLIRRAIWMAVTATAIIVLVFLAMRLWVLKPLDRLRTAVSAWARREFSVRTQAVGPDDIRVLALEFNSMAAELERYEAEREQAEEQRRRLEARDQRVRKLESLAVLAGGVAHDFNNSLTAVLGYLELTLMDLPPDSPLADNIERIKDAALRVSKLSAQMLAYSGRGAFVTKLLDLNDVLRAMHARMAAGVPEGIDLKMELAGGPLTVEGDAAQLEQVILNLLENASEAFESGPGTITVRTRMSLADGQYLAETYPGDDLPEGRYVCLEISDTGCGMDEETRTKAFEPFFTRKFTGRGLGLAVVLGIVRGHRGALKVETSPGAGTTVTVLLPSATDPAVSRPMQTPSDERPVHVPAGQE